ncbi:MAG: hypothetical protein ACI4JY_10050 [Oscillospiraceae bacterium]
MGKVTKNILSLLIMITTIVSLAFVVCHIGVRIKRNDWIITTAKITFIGTPDGVVFGTFTDYNGMLHTDQVMYTDDKFKPASLIKGPPRYDPKPYIGKTVKIMYNPEAFNLGGNIKIGTDIDSYDKWLQDFIVSGIIFIASCTSVVVVCVKTIQRKKAKSSEKKI